MKSIPLQNADPLAQLRDIHLPDPVSAWPPAPGWWLIGGLLLAATAALLYYGRRHYLGQRYRRAAIRELDSLYRQYQHRADTAAYLQALNILLRRVAVHGLGCRQAAGLTGEAWLRLLDSVSGPRGPRFSQGTGALLAAAPYQRPQQLAKIDGEAIGALHRLSRLWIRKHQLRKDGIHKQRHKGAQDLRLTQSQGKSP